MVTADARPDVHSRRLDLQISQSHRSDEDCSFTCRLPDVQLIALLDGCLGWFARRRLGDGRYLGVKMAAFEQITSMRAPRVIATYKCCRSISSGFRITPRQPPSPSAEGCCQRSALQGPPNQSRLLSYCKAKKRQRSGRHGGGRLARLPVRHSPLHIECP